VSGRKRTWWPGIETGFAEFRNLHFLLYNIYVIRLPHEIMYKQPYFKNKVFVDLKQTFF
jgi:hypothetical protein